MKKYKQVPGSLLLFLGGGFRFLKGDELPVATDEHIQHTDRSSDTPKVWTPCGREFTTLTAAKLLKVGIFVRRKKDVV